MERNENQSFMFSMREANPDLSKLELLPNLSRMNDSITIIPISHRFEENKEEISVLSPRILLEKPAFFSQRFSHFSKDKTPNSTPGFQRKEIDVFNPKIDKISQRFLIFSEFLDAKTIKIIISFFTIYALFADDIRIACTTKSADSVFDGFTITCFVIFSLEILLSVLVKDDYLFSFFFWLDIISSVSLIIDITFINEEIFGDSSTNQNFAKKAGKASKIGTRTGRIIRLVRLIRIVKLYKSYKNSMKEQDKIFPNGYEDSSPTHNFNSKKEKKSFFSFKVFNGQKTPNSPENPVNFKDSPMLASSAKDMTFDQENGWKDTVKLKDMSNMYKESRVGRKLSDLTMKRVIILVLILIFVVPLFSSSYFTDIDLDYTIQLKIMTEMSDTKTPNFSAILRIYQDYIDYNRQYPIIYCQIPSISKSFISMDPENLRNQEKQQLSYTLSLYNQPFITTVNIRSNQIMISMMNILRTLFVCLVLALGSFFFTKDVNDLALNPIERMIEKVNKIASNPLASKDQTLIAASDAMKYETGIIENAITKIGVLLALGFGEAGAEIIALNIAQSGDVDPMIPGKKRFSVFGFCDIRNFTDATEVLQQEVMVFVNSIAYIVHKTVDKFCGIANKNIGDAFLLVWKFPEEEIELLEDGKFALKKSRIVKNIADLSLVSFSKIIAQINKKPALLKYRENKGLNERLPNYKVKMGFGLHLGWAIEGAIGSEYKIDASYLSPNVNLASRLEAATKQYGVPILISHELFQFFSKKTKNLCREIDRVTVKGSKKPIGLFTIDLLIKNLVILEKMTVKSKHQKKIDHLSAKSNVLELAYSPSFKTSIFFELDNDLLLMTNDVSIDFKEKFKLGFDNYIQGNWIDAKDKFRECLDIWGEDGPCNTLMKVMGETAFVAEREWQGFRELTEK